ncbi:unnamed protein product [Diabrotica balteata]|uniref:Reverse transcriptase domain-containing protein n=1 Tax=Diabrotica balteata TaxID=107213 RepID=A0A9N9XFA8_DIABA|nr:unnamed protein product [Diabrotica balteata]
MASQISGAAICRWNLPSDFFCQINKSNGLQWVYGLYLPRGAESMMSPTTKESTVLVNGTSSGTPSFVLTPEHVSQNSEPNKSQCSSLSDVENLEWSAETLEVDPESNGNGNNVLLKCRDKRKCVFLCFIDYEKAFDRIKHTELIETLIQHGIDHNTVALIKKLYWDQMASIKIDNRLTAELPIKRGVRQGCVFSPLLFNIYSEKIFQYALENIEEGIKINGECVNNLRYADDTVIVADSAEGLQRLLNVITREGDSLGLNINTNKTKVMAVTRAPNIDINIRIYNKHIEPVQRFQYLGCWITSDLDHEVEMRARIEYARSAFQRMKKFLINSTLSLDIRY